MRLAMMESSGEQWRNLVAFWLLGYINNLGYVIMIAGAQEISAGGVGLVYFFDIFPALAVKLTGPYWFPYVSYRLRTFAGSCFMLLSFWIVALGQHSLSLQLLGVAFSGLQSGMMEASFLALASFYDSRKCITCWSSGTGLAGVGGYAWVATIHLWLGYSFPTTLMLASIFPLAYLLVFIVLLDTSHLPVPSNCIYSAIPETDMDKTEAQKAFQPSTLSRDTEEVEALRGTRQRLRFAMTLGPYMIPLTVVYFAEYTMQTGVWSAIGFPVHDEAARQQFYASAGLCYQTGVFLSRSSGVLFQATRRVLYLMPALQTLLLIFFSLVATYHFWYNWSLLIFCFIAGLLGGGVYVNAFTLISTEVAPSRVEFALSAASLGDTVGVMMADLAGLILQGCLYSINRLPGATVNITC